ncbi:MAG: 50S ribosomal protein L25 [Deltaproteobacteria bacterium]|nr:50S ribosomal protein L25 [Deltaproteobacteria bacterium]
MTQFALEAELRQDTGKSAARKLRMKGFVPAVFYAPGEKSILLSLNAITFEKFIKAHSGESKLFDLTIKGLDQNATKSVLLKDVQVHPMKLSYVHADFYGPRMDKLIEITIPVVLTGKPIGLAKGAILEQVSREMVIKCLPKDIPHEIMADVSDLDVGDSLHAKDIVLPEGAEIVAGVNFTVATMALPREEAEGTKAEPSGD